MEKKKLAHIPESKLKSVKELTDFINLRRTILFADIGSIPGSQFQHISKKLRGKAKTTENTYTRVLLDGQQRLTTLYLLVNGKSPPYYPDMLKTFNLFRILPTHNSIDI